MQEEPITRYGEAYRTGEEEITAPMRVPVQPMHLGARERWATSAPAPPTMFPPPHTSNAANLAPQPFIAQEKKSSRSGLIEEDVSEDGSALIVNVYPMSQFKCVMRTLYFFLSLGLLLCYFVFVMELTFDLDSLSVVMCFMFWGAHSGWLFYLSLSYHTFTIRADGRMGVEETTLGVMTDELIETTREQVRIDHEEEEGKIVLNCHGIPPRTISMNMPLDEVARLRTLLCSPSPMRREPSFPSKSWSQE